MLTLLLLACSKPTIGIHGDVLGEYFPTDGDRRSEYITADPAAPFTLVVEEAGTVTVDGAEQVTFAWSREDTGESLGSVTWSASESDGIAIHAWTDATGAEETFTPPVVVTEGNSRVGDVVPSETGGRAFTSTYHGLEDCPVAWGNDWTGCAHLTIDDGDGDDTAGPLFAGEYWLVKRYGAAWMHTTGYAEKWDLSHFESGE
ncbi:MAG: hypothetical protein ACK4YP_23890 [Myxococcota bacterium]